MLPQRAFHLPRQVFGFLDPFWPSGHSWQQEQTETAVSTEHPALWAPQHCKTASKLFLKCNTGAKTGNEQRETRWVHVRGNHSPNCCLISYSPPDSLSLAASGTLSANQKMHCRVASFGLAEAKTFWGCFGQGAALVAGDGNICCRPQQHAGQGRNQKVSVQRAGSREVMADESLRSPTAPLPQHEQKPSRAHADSPVALL